MRLCPGTCPAPQTDEGVKKEFLVRKSAFAIIATVFVSTFAQANLTTAHRPQDVDWKIYLVDWREKLCIDSFRQDWSPLKASDDEIKSQYRTALEVVLNNQNFKDEDLKNLSQLKIKTVRPSLFLSAMINAARLGDREHVQEIAKTLSVHCSKYTFALTHEESDACADAGYIKDDQGSQAFTSAIQSHFHYMKGQGFATDKRFSQSAAKDEESAAVKVVNTCAKSAEVQKANGSEPLPKREQPQQKQAQPQQEAPKPVAVKKPVKVKVAKPTAVEVARPKVTDEDVYRPINPRREIVRPTNPRPRPRPAQPAVKPAVVFPDPNHPIY